VVGVAHHDQLRLVVLGGLHDERRGLADGPGILGLGHRAVLNHVAGLLEGLVHVRHLGERALHGAAVAHRAEGAGACRVEDGLVDGHDEQRGVLLVAALDRALQGALGRIAAVVADQDGCAHGVPRVAQCP